MNIWETIKDHAWLVGGVVAAIVLFLFMRGGSGGSVSGVAAGDGSTNTTPVDNTLAVAQLQAQTQLAGFKVQADAQDAAIGGQIQMAQIQADAYNTGKTLDSEIALAQLTSTNHANDLSTQVEEQKISASLQQSEYTTLLNNQTQQQRQELDARTIQQEASYASQSQLLGQTLAAQNSQMLIDLLKTSGFATAGGSGVAVR